MSAGAVSGPVESARLEFQGTGAEWTPSCNFAALRRWHDSLRRWSPSERWAVHPVLLDRTGAWVWPHGDRHALATRVDDLDGWMRARAGQRLALWLSAELLADRLHADRTAYDVAPQLRQAAQSRVRVDSMMPWWRHAADEAQRCLPWLARMATAQVCVVEGRRLSCLISTSGVLAEVRHLTLPAANLDALQVAMRCAGLRTKSHDVATVVVGQGLAGGGQTHALDAVVLGRLDGLQPPQWLRPRAGRRR